MYGIWGFIYIICFSGNVEFLKTQSCKEEIRSIKQITIKWPSTEIFSSVISEPPCVDNNKVLLNRTCLNGQWFPKKYDCDYVQEEFKLKCKDKDLLDQSGYCLHISKPQHWTSEQPVLNVEDVTSSNILYSLYYINIKQFWLPVRRKEKYGKYVWTIPKYYGDKFLPYVPILFNNQENTTFKPEFSSYECMIVTNVKEYRKENITQIGYFAEPRDCNDQYRTVHAYLPEFIHYTAKNGIYFSNHNKNAYFIQTKCQLLAEPKTKEDNFLIKKLVKNQTCRIGIERNDNATFVWKNSKQVIKYTDWIPSTNFSNSEVVVTKDGWKLENKTVSINCSVCQVDHTKYKTKLELQPNKNHTQLILTQYSSMKIIPVTLRTIGLEDINLEDTNMIQYNVYNDFNNVQNEYEKLNKRDLWIVDLNNSKSNYYYVESLVIPEGRKIKTDKTYLALNTAGREYAFKVKVKKFCNVTNFYCDPHLSNYYLNLSQNLLMQSNTILRQNGNNVNTSEHINNIVNVRAMKIDKICDNGDIRIIFHLIVNSTFKNISTEYVNIIKLLRYLSEIYEQYEISIDSVRNRMGCLPHTSMFDNRLLTWKFTEIGRIFSHTNCLQTNEYLYIRKCSGDLIEGAKWSTPKKRKQDFSKYSEQFCKLYETRSTLTPQEAIRNLTNLTKTPDLKPIDIYYISEIVRNISKVIRQMNVTVSTNYKSLATNMSVVMNNLLACNASSLEESNMNTNSTNNFVADVEHYLPQITENDLDERGVNTIIQKNLLFSIFDPFVSNITGIALIKPNFEVDNLPFTQYGIKYLFANETIKNVVSIKNMEIAAFVPEQLLNDIRNKSYNKPVRIAMFLFYNDSLFIENNLNSNNISKPKLLTRVLDISIKGYDNYLFSPIPVISKLKRYTNNLEFCSYWDFGSEIYNLTSRWNTNNILDVQYLINKNIQVCNFTHLTHYAVLLENSILYEISTLKGNYTKNAEFIIATGSCLSIFGICGIYFTAILFKTWRNKVRHKIVLNFCSCILLQIILLHMNIKYSYTSCLLTGSLLHYSVLCGFFWSLVMAYLQYLKFVKVINLQTSHLLLKSSIVGWGIPVIPVTIALVFSYFSIGVYNTNLESLGLHLCYPQDALLYWTLLLPIVLIIFANLISFLLIFYNLSRRAKLRSTSSVKEIVIQQIKLAIFLYFLFEFSWISGLLSFIYKSIKFLYIFYLTTTTQGFVLFIFYIIVNHQTRQLWINLFKLLEKPWKSLKQASIHE